MPFPSVPKSLFEDEAYFQAFDMKTVFHSHGNKMYFGIELLQFITRLCFNYCNARLQACLQGFFDWIVLVFKVLKGLINSFRSRFFVVFRQADLSGLNSSSRLEAPSACFIP